MYKANKMYLVKREPDTNELKDFNFPVVFRVQLEDGLSYDVTYNETGERTILRDSYTKYDSAILSFIPNKMYFIGDKVIYNNYVWDVIEEYTDLEFKEKYHSKLYPIFNNGDITTAKNDISILQKKISNLENEINNKKTNDVIVSTEAPSGISTEGAEWIMYDDE